LSSHISNFHKSKKSAAVLKHEIINQYATPFASKTGSRSLDNRVAFIDGYAGPGRYEDGEEGSGAMLLRKAREMASLPRRVECHFVEENPAVAQRLREVAAAEAGAVTYTVSEGNISLHLPKLLDAAKGIPLFTYLDPCGLIIPLDEVASIFDRPSGLARVFHTAYCLLPNDLVFGFVPVGGFWVGGGRRLAVAGFSWIPRVVGSGGSVGQGKASRRRCQPVAMAPAQRQAVSILSRVVRAERVMRAATCRMR